MRAALLVVMAGALTLTAAGPAQAAPRAAAPAPMPPLPELRTADTNEYLHTGMHQATIADGAMATVTIGKPLVAPDASHSLASVAVRTASGHHNVQIGWTVDPLLNGDDLPHLFVIHRVAGVDACYNVCGFEPYAASTVRPGAVLPVGTSKRFGVQHFDGRWWVAYDGQWLGYFPDSLWSNTFTQAETVQYFGEVSGGSDPACSEMGTGLPVTSVEAARFGTISLIGATSVPLRRNPFNAFYGLQLVSDRTFRYGGPAYDLC